MSDFVWELRRSRDDLLVDRAHQLWLLLRAMYVSIEYIGSNDAHSHKFVHADSGEVVGYFRGRRVTIDRERFKRLAPDERVPTYLEFTWARAGGPRP